MSDKVKSRREKILAAGFVAVDELIKVLQAPILSHTTDGGTDTVSAEKMKIAASAKRLSMDDALAMCQTLQDLEDDLNGTTTTKKEFLVKRTWLYYYLCSTQTNQELIQ